MKAKKKPNPVVGKFSAFCDEQALKIAKSVLSEIEDVDKSEWEEFVAEGLKDELIFFFRATFVFLLSDPDGDKWLKTLLAMRAGRASGATRLNRSTKLKFLTWALDENARNPSRSKTAVAEQFARDNQGVSVPTLRRYLAGIPWE